MESDEICGRAEARTQPFVTMVILRPPGHHQYRTNFTNFTTPQALEQNCSKCNSMLGRQNRSLQCWVSLSKAGLPNLPGFDSNGFNVKLIMVDPRCSIRADNPIGSAGCGGGAAPRPTLPLVRSTARRQPLLSPRAGNTPSCSHN